MSSLLKGNSQLSFFAVAGQVMECRRGCVEREAHSPKMSKCRNATVSVNVTLLLCAACILVQSITVLSEKYHCS